MKKHTDESVKAGLQVESNKDLLKEQQQNIGSAGYPDGAKETDADDLVHEKEEEIISQVNGEQDIDELVHQRPVSKKGIDNEERDPDDLVHEREDYSDE